MEEIKRKRRGLKTIINMSQKPGIEMDVTVEITSDKDYFGEDTSYLEYYEVTDIDSFKEELAEETSEDFAELVVKTKYDVMDEFGNHERVVNYLGNDYTITVSLC